MSKAKIHLVDGLQLGYFYFTQDAAKLAQDLFVKGQYTQEGPEFDIPFEGEAAAEELFDLTNNPMRQPGRRVRYGCGRSLSVGDIVEVDGEFYVCRPNGWLAVDLATV